MFAKLAAHRRLPAHLVTHNSCTPVDTPHVLKHVLSGPKAPAAGSTPSKLAVSDAAQLKSLLAFKAAVDGTNILRGEWLSTGRLLCTFAEREVHAIRAVSGLLCTWGHSCIFSGPTNCRCRWD